MPDMCIIPAYSAVHGCIATGESSVGHNMDIQRWKWKRKMVSDRKETTRARARVRACASVLSSLSGRETSAKIEISSLSSSF